MDISLATIMPGLGPPASARGLPIELGLGQLLSALVLDKLATGRANLLIHGAKVAVATRASLQAGDQLTLRVERLAPVVHLKILPHIRPGPVEVRNNALLFALPRQLPLAAAINDLVANVFPIDPKTPSALKTAAHALVDNAPRIEHLSHPKTIRETLLRSGTFFEPRLAQSAAEPAGSGWLETDLKALLLKLRAALSTTPRARGSTPRPTQGAGANPRPPNGPVSAARPVAANQEVVSPKATCTCGRRRLAWQQGQYSHVHGTGAGADSASRGRHRSYPAQPIGLPAHQRASGRTMAHRGAGARR